MNGCLLPLASVLLTGCTILATYLSAISHGHAAFPQSDITHSGLHPPESAYFRMGMLTGVPLLAAASGLLHAWLACFLDPPGWFLPWALAAAGCLAVAEASLQEGAMNFWTWNIHTVLVDVFFVLQYGCIFQIRRLYLSPEGQALPLPPEARLITVA
jgi:hypothetical protein